MSGRWFTRVVDPVNVLTLLSTGWQNEHWYMSVFDAVALGLLYITLIKKDRSTRRVLSPASEFNVNLQARKSVADPPIVLRGTNAA
jgi:hypothetical protein